MSSETFQEGQDVYFLHPIESWIKGVVKEVIQTKTKSGSIEVSYTCQGTPEKTLLPTVTGQGAIVSKLPPSSLHHVVFTGPATGDESGAVDPKAVTFSPDGRDTFSDLLDLSYLHDSTLLEQVRKRYFANLIYTRIGPIVLALNPYDYSLPNYIDSNMPRYIAEGSVIVANAGKSQLLPHAWSTAHYSYWLLSNGESRSNQSVIVSGDSGAGKTETAKIVVKYLGKVSTSACSDSVREVATQVTARVNLTSPILEAFGNAKTKKNDNSSRFGKFMKVHFSIPNDGTGGVMVGVSIDVYLLEKSRVITHGDGERAYHCFYQLLAQPKAKPADKQSLLKSLHLGEADDYTTLNIGKATEIQGVDDAADWQEVVNAMNAVGLSAHEESSVWKVVATVLHLLDVKISALSHDECEIEGIDAVCGGGPATGRKRSQSMAPGRDVPSADRATKNAQHLEAVREIIGVDMNLFAAELTTTKSVIQGETIIRKLKKAASIDVRDAICKFLYEALFLWLVAKINALISPPDEANDTWIALLDIFGFENFQHNSFEQMCINLANETLQNHYNSVVFTRDMAECHNEGIDTASVTFYDNQPCLDMVCGVNFSMCGLPSQTKSIVTSKLSITSLLDDESSLGNGSDLSFCAKLEDAFGVKGTKPSHPNFEKPKTQNNAFIIKHYAGDVKYTVDGFRSKNADTTKDSLKELLLGSPNAFVSGLVTHYQTSQQEAMAQTQASGSGLKASNTVSGFFKNQLVRLMTEINRTHPHWIRCVKPHSAKKPRMFSGEEVMTQMRSAGVLETVRIRQQSFSIRLPFVEFLRGPASLFLKKMPMHTVRGLEAKANELVKAAKEAEATYDAAVASKATPGKLRELTQKLDTARQIATTLNTVLAEMKASNGVAVEGSANEQCKAILRRCGVDSHEMAQVGTTKVFMRAPAFQQVGRQESVIKTALSTVVSAMVRGRDSNLKVRCLQLNRYVKTISGCLQARASETIVRKKELVILEKDLITRFRDLLLNESAETRTRDVLQEEEHKAFSSIVSVRDEEMRALREDWLAAMANKHKEERNRIEANEAADRTCTLMNEEERAREVLRQLLTIFDDEAEGRLEVEADEEDERNERLEAESLLLFEAVKEARVFAAALALRRCEDGYDSGRATIVREQELTFYFFQCEEALLQASIRLRAEIVEEEDEAWERDIAYEHKRGWSKQRALWDEQQSARVARLIRLLQRHETNGRAEVEVEYEQGLIGIYTLVDDSIADAQETMREREEKDLHARRIAAKERQRAEQERHERWVEEQREIAKAIWVAAKQAEAELRAHEKAKEQAYALRVHEAEKVRERIRAQQEREIKMKGKSSALKPAGLTGPIHMLNTKRPPSVRSSATQLAIGHSLSPSRAVLGATQADTASPYREPSQAASHSSGAAPAPLSANDKFKFLMARLDAVSSSDLTPRSKQSLRLQLARGTDDTFRAASPNPYRPDDTCIDGTHDDAASPSCARDDDYQDCADEYADRESSPVDTSSTAQMDLHMKEIMSRFDAGASPLGRYRDAHSPTSDGASLASGRSYFSPQHGSGRFSSPYSEVKDQLSLAMLSRKGISITAGGRSVAASKSFTPSSFHNVSTNPFDPTWEPVAGGTKAYLPDGSLVDVA